uniref:Uncharacterized protein n=1 Tax=Anguilla anguilla TaxID=7936 RepID=A0A0E9SVR9_ANGAN
MQITVTQHLSEHYCVPDCSASCSPLYSDFSHSCTVMNYAHLLTTDLGPV